MQLPAPILHDEKQVAWSGPAAKLEIATANSKNNDQPNSVIGIFGSPSWWAISGPAMVNGDEGSVLTIARCVGAARCVAVQLIFCC